MAINFADLKLKPNPNQYLVCPEGYCQKAKPHRIAPVFKVSAGNLRASWFAAVLKEPRVTHGSSDEGRNQHEFIQRSALMGFADDISVVFIPLSPTSSTLAIYSRSRVGWSDLGVNRSRIEGWLGKMTVALG